MAEEGRGQRHSAPKVAPVTGQPFKSFDNAPRRAKRQKGHCMELQGTALFWFSPKFTRQKFSNRENFFQLAHFCQQKFFRFQRKNLGKKVCAQHARKRAIAQFDFVAFFTRAFVLFLIRFSEIV